MALSLSGFLGVSQLVSASFLFFPSPFPARQDKTMNKPGGGWEGHDAGVNGELLREVLQDLEGPVAGSRALR